MPELLWTVFDGSLGIQNRVSDLLAEPIAIQGEGIHAAELDYAKRQNAEHSMELVDE